MKVQQELSNQITISLHKEEATLLLSLVEFYSRYDFQGAVTEEELNLASILTGELESYVSFEEDVEVIDYINDTYK